MLILFSFLHWKFKLVFVTNILSNVNDFFFAMLNEEYHKVVVDDVGIPKILQSETFVALKERDLIEALKEIR